MKFLAFVLAVSIAANAVLVAAFVAKPSLAPASVRSYFEFGGNRTDTNTQTPAPARSPKRPKAPTPLWATLQAEELPTLVGRLRAAGFPPMIVRAIVEAEIERRFSGRLKELTRSLQETPYWKPDPSYYMGNSKLFEEISQIYRERSKLMRELLGKDALAYGHMDPGALQRRQFGNLSQQKIDLVQRIVDDYAEMSAQIRSAMQGIALPEDREKLALLEREKRADLAAILAPEELADYEMRSSNVTSRLRTAFTIMGATEAEFRTLFQIHQAHADILYPTGFTVFTSDFSEKRREAQQTINDQVKAALGEKRFAEYQRATSSEFQQLFRLAQRDNLPYDTLVRAYDVRVPAAEASTRIMNDRALSPEQRQAALKELAQTSRTQLLSTLGPVVGPGYVQTARWLSYIDQGGAVSIMPDGNLSYRSPPSPPRSSTTPKK